MDDMFPTLPYPPNEKKILPTSSTFRSSEDVSADDFLQLIGTLEPIPL